MFHIMGECHHWYVPVKHIMGEWKYEVYVVLSITGTYLTGHVSNQIISGIEASIPGALAQIKEAFRVKGKDFCEASHQATLDAGFFRTDVNVVFFVKLDRKGFLNAKAGGSIIGKMAGRVVSIDRTLRQQVEAGFKAEAFSGFLSVMSVTSVNVKITKRGS